MRLLLRDALTRDPQRLTAGLIGIGRGALRKFLGMSYPSEENYQKIGVWCKGRLKPDAPADLMALTGLAEEVPASRRVWARRRVAETLSAMHLELERQPPGWLLVGSVRDTAPGKREPA